MMPYKVRIFPTTHMRSRARGCCVTIYEARGKRARAYYIDILHGVFFFLCFDKLK